MVSLSNSTGHQGSFSEFADHDHLHPSLYAIGTGTNSSTENLLLPSHATQDASLYSWKNLVRKFPGTWFICLYILLLIGFVVISYVFYDVLHLQILGGIDEPFALLCVCHVGVWLVTFVYDRYLHFHHQALRKYGYLNFFTKTKEVRKIPLGIFSLGNAVLLLVVAFTGGHPNKGMLSLIQVFQIVASAEVFICLFFSIVYLYYVILFNKTKNLPDVFDQDTIHGFNEDMYTSPEVGFRDSECLDDILEKQSEMIRYLQQHNKHLGKQIVELTKMLPTDAQTAILDSSNIAPGLLSR